MTAEQFTDLALSFNGTEQKPHFNRIAFKVIKKKTFATLHEPSKTANIVLTLEDQKAFCELDKDRIYPVPNKWGSVHGWTTFEIELLPEEIIKEAIYTAYSAVFGKE